MVLGILGATSHVAKNLISEYAGSHELHLFARSPKAVDAFISSNRFDCSLMRVMDIGSFINPNVNFDAVINCVGLGTPEKLKDYGWELQALTEHIDDMALGYLRHHLNTVLVNFSSGALYGTVFDKPVDEKTPLLFEAGGPRDADSYRVSKLNSETKHRCMHDLNIFDLRLFGFFSRFIDPNSAYLVCDLVRSVANGSEFITSKSDIIRDYVHPKDLGDIVLRCSKNIGMNEALDVYSAQPIRKSELIAAFRQRFGLKIKIIQDPVGESPTGGKSHYFSKNKKAEEFLGYTPSFTSLETVCEEASALIEIMRLD